MTSDAGGSGNGSSDSSDPAAADPELAAALDSFVDWARHGDLETGEAPLLPRLHLNEGLEPGSVLGDYELVRRLGIGGMGIVFEARQRSVAGRRVAVKVLRTVFATEQMARRFEREIATVAELDHPNIVPIVDARVEGGTPYYAMKYVEGASVDQVVKRLRRDSRLPHDCSAIRASIEGTASHGSSRSASTSAPNEGSGSAWESSYVRWVARVGLQVAEALQYAHERGFVHRDVKPGNVLIKPGGSPVLLDFGLATGLDDDTITQTGEFLGTLAYAPPEQVLGRTVDARADVYSLGATLYELLTLAKPFDARDHSDLMRRITRELPRSIGYEVPVDLRTIVACAMSKAPGRRYATAAALAHDLRAFLAGQAIQARPPGLGARARRWFRNHPFLATAAGVALLVVSGIRVDAHRRARDKLEAGERVLAASLEAQDELYRSLERYEALLRAEPPDFLALAEEGEVIERARLGVELRFEQAESILLAAFEHVAGHAPARRALARLHAQELNHALRLYDDVLRPGRVTRIESELARFDDAGEYDDLCVRRGQVRIECDAPGATIEVRGGQAVTDQAPVIRAGPAPFEATLPEGSYLAFLRAPDRAEATLPFLVRRDACSVAGDARPVRDHRVELLRVEEAPDGFVYVPAGETLVVDDPPVWEAVPPFLIMRHEVTNAQLVEWLTRLERDPVGVGFVAGAEPEFLPRDSVGRHLDRGSDGGWFLREDLDPRWPARGLSAMELGFHVDALELLAPARPEDWYVSVPRLSEWVRAARGADGRRFPWGSDFERERCASYLSCGHFGRNARPLPVGARTADRSPFDVHDLAGSVAEWTWDLGVPLPGNYAASGGSFQSWNPDDLTCTSVRALPNEPFQDVGFRFVMRRLPEWCLVPDEAPRPFRDDFERPDGDDVGHGWIELAGVPLGLPTNPSEPERCSIVGGRLVARGGIGDFSEETTALHRIHVPESDFTIQADLRATHEAAFAETRGRKFGIRAARVSRATEREALTLTLDFDGRPELTWSATGSPAIRVASSPVSTEGLLSLELHVSAGTAEGRVWACGRPRPAVPTVTIQLPAQHRAPRYLVLGAPNYVGARVEVEQVTVLPGH